MNMIYMYFESFQTYLQNFLTYANWQLRLYDEL